jgi:hypothetical protein
MRHAAVLLVLLCAPALAQDPAELAEYLARPLRNGTAGAVGIFEDYDDEALEVLAKSPKHALIVCTAALENIERFAARHPDGWRRVTEFVVKLGARCLELAPKDRDAVRTAAQAALCRVRFARTLKESAPVEGWAREADLLVWLHERLTEKEPDNPAGREPLEAALGLLLDSAPSADPGARKRLDTICERGRRLYPGAQVFLLASMRRRLEQLTAKPDRAEFSGLLEEWRKRAASKGAHPRILDLYHDAVSYVRGNRKLRLKPDYITLKRTTRSDYMSFEAPAGTRWSWTESNDWTEVGRLRRIGEQGRVVALISFHAYSMDTPRMLADMRIDELRDELRDLKPTGKPRKKGLNKRISKAFRYEVGGLDEKGDFVRCRGWLFRGKNVICLVEVREIGAGRADPECDSVLASVREGPAR